MDKASVDRISVKIFTASERFGIPLSKDNYALLYEYYEGYNQSLTFAMDVFLNGQKPLSPEALETLYRQYVEPETKTATEKVQRQTQKMISDMLKGILSANDSSSAYEATLKTYSAGLTKVKSIDQVHGIITGLLKETKQMAVTNQKLQEEFKTAKSQSKQLSRKLQQMEQVATTDALTGLYNRRHFDSKLEHLVQIYQRLTDPFSVIAVDIDFFKKFNDTYGHAIGDEVLKIVGGMIKKGVKGGDIPTRYGGEEFFILLPETQLKSAAIVAEQLRIRIAVRPLAIPGTAKDAGKITVSLGVSEMNPNDTAASVVARADKALYMAKESGRNRVCTQRDLRKKIDK